MEKKIGAISINGRSFKGAFGYHEVKEEPKLFVDHYQHPSERLMNKVHEITIHPASYSNAERFLDLLAYMQSQQGQRIDLTIEGSYVYEKGRHFEGEMNLFEYNYECTEHGARDMTLVFRSTHVTFTQDPPNFHEQFMDKLETFYTNHGRQQPAYVIITEEGYEEMKRHLLETQNIKIDESCSGISVFEGCRVVKIKGNKIDETKENLYIEFGC